MRNRSAANRLMLSLILWLAIGGAIGAEGARQLGWYSMSSGGGHAASPNFQVDVTIGQTAAGLAYSPNYRLGAGFWYVTGIPELTLHHVALPVLLKSY